MKVDKFVKAGIIYISVFLCFIYIVFYHFGFYFGTYYIGALDDEGRYWAAVGSGLKPEAAERVKYVWAPHDGDGATVFELKETPADFAVKYADAEISNKAALRAQFEEPVEDGKNVLHHAYLIEYVDKVEKDHNYPEIFVVKDGSGYAAVIPCARNGHVYNKKYGLFTKTGIILENLFLKKYKLE